jgi:hypothetical protein
MLLDQFGDHRLIFHQITDRRSQPVWWPLSLRYDHISSATRSSISANRPDHFPLFVITLPDQFRSRRMINLDYQLS